MCKRWLIVASKKLEAQQQAWKANQVNRKNTLCPKGHNSQWGLSCTAQKLSLHHYLINNMNVIERATGAWHSE